MKKHLKAQYERFCALLIEARRESGLSQEDVADRLNRPQSYISKCEAGTRRMDVIEFMEVMNAIGSDPVRIIRKLK